MLFGDLELVPFDTAVLDAPLRAPTCVRFLDRLRAIVDVALVKSRVRFGNVASVTEDFSCRAELKSVAHLQATILFLEQISDNARNEKKTAKRE